MLRNNRRIGRSSSMTSTRGPGSLIFQIRLLLPSYVGRNRKRNNGARRYAPFGPDAPSVRFHETATDGESETASACLPASPVKTLKHELHLLLGYPWSA